MKKNIIFIKKKNFFFNKLSSLLEKESFTFKKVSDLKDAKIPSACKAFFFFFVDSKEEFIELKEVDKSKFKNLNFIVFKKKELLINIDFNTVFCVNLPLNYNDLLVELKRITEKTNINKNHYVLGEYLFNPKTSELHNKSSLVTINLTELESKFLYYMLKKKNGATKSQILSEVWKHNKMLNTHTLESLIYRLRKKIEKNPNKPSILINDTKKYIINS